MGLLTVIISLFAPKKEAKKFALVLFNYFAGRGLRHWFNGQIHLSLNYSFVTGYNSSCKDGTIFTGFIGLAHDSIKLLNMGFLVNQAV